MGDRKCGAFLSFVDRDTHPTCTRCRGHVCASDMFCDICAIWSATQWEQFVRRVLTKRKKSSRPSGSVPTAPPTSPPAETSLGVSPPGTSSSSSFLPLGGQGRRRGLRVHLVFVWGGLPPLPLDLGRARGVEVPLGCTSGARSRFSFSFGSGRSGSCPLAVDSLFPRLQLRCLSPILTARSTT